LTFCKAKLRIKKMEANNLIDALGGTHAVASLLGIKPPSVSGWRAAGRIPYDKLVFLAVVAEEREIVTRKQLFPLDYVRIWPELRAGDAAASEPVPA
jgi:DNA-binding transcriptional regulator YdaS (Cro superfamily)